jgi:hypothetical protein
MDILFEKYGEVFDDEDDGKCTKDEIDANEFT